MDQGLAAVWAGVAGLVGAGVGGGFAVWGAAIGGRRTVEAAERQAHRAAVTEHQHWLREQRYEAYEELEAVVEPMMHWGDHVPWEEARLTIDRVRKVARRVQMLGPMSALMAMSDLNTPIGNATSASWSDEATTEPCPPRPGVPYDIAGHVDLVWHPYCSAFWQAYGTFVTLAREVVDQAPT